MSAVPPVRPDLQLTEGYHSPQVEAEVRLNTNESPFAPPAAWREELLAALAEVSFHRYPDRPATELRQAVADLHGVTPDEVFCANGSNEVLQCLLLAFGGPGRRALVFEPTYALHSHIARIAGTEVVEGARDDDFLIDPRHALGAPGGAAPRRDLPLFAQQPDRPGGAARDRRRRERGGTRPRHRRRGLRAVLPVVGPGAARAEQPGLVVTRTFSKTWAMAGARLGYLVADPAVVAACESVVLPYHLSAQTQIAGLVALRHVPEMEARVARISEERGRVAAALADLPVDSWPSDANFILFRPRDRNAVEVWRSLLDHSVLIRNCANWDGLRGCLRVTIGTAEENDRFLHALKESL